MQVDKTTLNNNDATTLKQRLASLKLPLPVKTDSVFKVLNLPERKFKMEPNSKNIENISFTKKNNVMTVTIKTNKDSYVLNFGSGKWVEGKTTMLGPSLVEAAKNHFVGLPPSQVAGSYSWKNAGVLEMHLRYIDSPHTEIITFYLGDKNVTVDIQDSFKTPDKKLTLKGESVQ